VSRDSRRYDGCNQSLPATVKSIAVLGGHAGRIPSRVGTGAMTGNGARGAGRY